MTGDVDPSGSVQRLPHDLPLEQWRLITAAGAALLGFAVSVVLTWGGRHPLFGANSVAEYAALICAGVAGVAFAVWFLWALRSPNNQWRRRIRLVFRVIDFAGLVLTHAAVALLGMSGIFWIFSEAFVDLTLDSLSTSAIIATGAAVTAYLSVGSAFTMSTRQVAQLLAVFVGVGALSSMLSASDPLWWQSHFSSLGAASDLSGLAFNFTLLLGGLVITTLAGFLTHDLMRWSRLAGVESWRVFAIRVTIVAMGLLLGALAFLPVNRFFIAHNVVAYTMVGLFLVMAIAVPLLFPTLSRPFSIVCVTTLAVLVAGLVAYLGVGYLNLTAFELLMVAGIFGWMILFIGTVDSAEQHLEARVSPHQEIRTGVGRLGIHGHLRIGEAAPGVQDTGDQDAGDQDAGDQDAGDVEPGGAAGSQPRRDLAAR